MELDGVSSMSFYSGVAKSFEDTIVSDLLRRLCFDRCGGLLAFVVLYNLTNVNISEFTREIATIKVLGFHPKRKFLRMSIVGKYRTDFRSAVLFRKEKLEIAALVRDHESGGNAGSDVRQKYWAAFLRISRWFWRWCFADASWISSCIKDCVGSEVEITWSRGWIGKERDENRKPQTYDKIKVWLTKKSGGARYEVCNKNAI